MTQPLVIHVETPQVELGEDLRFQVFWNVKTQARGIFVTLNVHVQSQGDDVNEKVMDIRVPTHESDGSAKLAFSLPHSLTPSYSGKLFNVTWLVRARLDLRRQVDPVAEEPVQIRPNGWRQAMAMHRTPPSAVADRPINDLPIINPDAGHQPR